MRFFAFLPGRAWARLRDSRGFMLAEQLVSIIFIGLLCVVVAAGLGAALSAYGNITAQANADNLLLRSVQVISDQLAFSQEPDGTTFVSSSENVRGSLQNAQAGAGIEFSYSYKVKEPGKEEERTASTLLVPSKTNGNGTVEFSVSFPGDGAPKYDRATNTWTYTVNVEDASKKQLAIQNITVKRVMAAPPSETKTESGA